MAPTPVPRKTSGKQGRGRKLLDSGTLTSTMDLALAKPMKHNNKLIAKSSGPYIAEKAIAWFGLWCVCLTCLVRAHRHLMMKQTPKDVLRPSVMKGNFEWLLSLFCCFKNCDGEPFHFVAAKMVAALSTGAAKDLGLEDVRTCYRTTSEMRGPSSRIRIGWFSMKQECMQTHIRSIPNHNFIEN
jgi:hypothetical protein